MKINQLLAKSIQFTDQLVLDLPTDGWERDTTCSPWTLRDLLNHVTYEWLWAPELFAGKTVKEVGDKYDGDVLGDEPIQAYQQASKKFIAAVEQVDPNSIVHLSYADVSAQDYMFQLTVEALIHGWDLAVSSGQAGAIPVKLAEELYRLSLQQIGDIESAGDIYGHRLKVEPGAGTQTKLLALFGRSNSNKAVLA
jgi:uncharacterized protein (TIGR03086 family)